MPRQPTTLTLDKERAHRLVEARLRTNLQQQAVAAHLQVARGTVRRWERGYWIDQATLKALAELYDVTVESLQGREGAAVPAPMPASTNTEWPQWARERWAEVQLELVRMGVDDDAVTLLRTFVLSPHLLTKSLTEEQLRQDVEAGVAAARAWAAARTGRQGGP